MEDLVVSNRGENDPSIELRHAGYIRHAIEQVKDLGGTQDENLGTVLGPSDPKQVGPYRILSVLGKGGMGKVYLAEQQPPLRRRVALKVIKADLDSEHVLARFEAERQALALLDHSNIAKVFDAGTTEEGRPYFAMEYIAGERITDYCDRHQLDTTARLRLFIQICEGVQHAHQKAIIHRDIKPSNILVTEQDGKPVPKIIDFGVAKATDQKLTERSFQTEIGQIIGTLGYMSREQLLTPHDVDTRTDIYSLGVLLYELLVGEPPFDDKMLREAGLAEIQRMIREVDPPKPSTRLSALGSGISVPEPSPSGGRYQPNESRGSSIDDIAHRRHTEPKTLIRQIRGDLDWIVMRAMEKDRTRRYPSATELAAELQRFLAHQPVVAGPPSASYRVKKFVRRNKVVVAGVSAIVAALATGLFISDHQRRRALRAEVLADQRLTETEAALDQAETARDEAEQVTLFLTDTLAAADPSQQGKDVTVREVLDRTAAGIGEKFSNKPLIEARLRYTLGRTYHGMGLLSAAETHLTEAVVIYTHELGPRDRRTLAAANMLAVAIGDRRGFGQAEASLQASLEIQRRVLGEEHPDTLGSMHNLAKSLNDQGRYAEAEALYRETLQIRRRDLGEEHLETLRSVNNLANCLDDQGRYDEAEKLRRKTLETRRRVLGEEHPDTLGSMNGLANSLFDQARYAEAEELLRKTIVIQRRVLGQEHADTLLSMNNLAVSLVEQGRYAEAEEIYRRNLEIQRRVLGREHPGTLRSMHNLARRLHDQGRYDEAEELYHNTLDIQRRVLGDEHPDVAVTLHNLADTLEKMELWPEAEEVCRQAGSIWASRFPPVHSYHRISINLLGAILSGQGRFSEAEPMLLESYEALRGDPGLRPRDRKEMLERLVRLYESWDAAEPGKGYAEKATEWRTRLDVTSKTQSTETSNEQDNRTPNSGNDERPKTDDGQAPK